MLGIVIGASKSSELNAKKKNSYVFGAEFMLEALYVTSFNTGNNTLRQILESLISFYRLGN